MTERGHELSERKKQILKAVVEAHVEGGGPIGSKAILQSGGMNCSSATIRNEMAELEEWGYLEQPHASAGRVPSELGYRFYVDSLVEEYAMTAHEIAQINDLMRVKMGELDQILNAASNLASRLTNYTGIAIRPRTRTLTVTRFEAVYLSSDHLILIAVMSNGEVRTRHVTLDLINVEKEFVSRLIEAMNRLLVGLTVDRITLPIIAELERQLNDNNRLVGPVIKALSELMSESEGGEMRVSGLDHLLQYPEYSDTGQLRELLGTLEKKDDILDLVSSADGEKDVNVLIGSESQVRVMSNSALVFKPIVRDGETLGAIGILGPRRMDYAKVLATLEGLSGNIETMIRTNQPICNGGETDGRDKTEDGSG